MCTTAGVPRQLHLDAIRTSSERNEAAHYPPPRFEDHHTGGVVDWDAISAACKERKTTVEDDFENGTLTEAQKDFFLQAIDMWLELRVSWSEDDGLKPTEAGDPLAATLKTTLGKKGKEGAAPARPPVPPPSPYVEGKWDDLETST
ncbi:hypothetical protein BGZ61DRAFT_455033 [Ilyonectria robusta]|uniref:uncharacterized protein n=1 Tax=Ilyonectria robusta TaxID=1079257 RepID=UPI001E8E9C14|nr:uncharacterized protein BGZ61DRAFT_455033 [Ilyonectria robusta]KAH8685180.1 hypothetical protein BGZ61DRAFT_455033 [Ilyonectria robusta]